MYIPRFCWHERMKPVGMCRMCLVEVEGGRGFPPACTTPVTEGMVCNTQSETVKKIQDGVLEFLLVNHPLDCPVCDRGGECPLQDQTLAFGPGESRFVEEKRHFEKPIQLSELVLLDRERCIQCARCTRFADEIAGDPLIDFVDRGDHMQVLNFAEQPFDSYFSGNTVQICPVGALTASQYRFRARPWDLATVETSCNDLLGAVPGRAAVVVEPAGPAARRRLRAGQPRMALRQGPLRHRVDPLRQPCARAADPRRWRTRREVSWPDALALRPTRSDSQAIEHGPGSIAVLGGARGTNEDAYVWSLLARASSAPTTSTRSSATGSRPSSCWVCLAPRSPTRPGAARSCLLDPDLEEELPVLHLRLRRAARGARSPARRPRVRYAPGLSAHAAVGRAPLPGRASARTCTPDQAARQRPSRGPGRRRSSARPSLAESPRRRAVLPQTLPACTMSASSRRCAAATCTARSMPASRPASCPGASPSKPAGVVHRALGRVLPAERGHDAAGILEAAAAGQIEVLVMLGSDPIARLSRRRRSPGAARRRRRRSSRRRLRLRVVEEGRGILPSTLAGEKSGTVTNLEGRVQRVGRKVAPEGRAMDDWRIAAELSLRLGTRSTSRSSTS